MTTLDPVAGDADARPPLDNLVPAALALQTRFGVTRSHAYELIRDGAIATVRIGSKIVVAESELTRFRASLRAYTSSSTKAA